MSACFRPNLRSFDRSEFEFGHGWAGRPALWNLILDEAVGLVLREWHRKGYGIYIPALAADPNGNAPRSQEDSACLVKCLAYADDLLLLA